MTSTEPYIAATTQARKVTEKSIEAWRNGAKTFTDQLERVRFPTIDLTEPVTRYFDSVQRAVDFNRDLATRWAELVTTLSGSVREQAAKVTGIVNDQTNTIADLTAKQAEKAEEIAKKQADTVEHAKKDQAQQAREPYEGLTKAELVGQLTERGLPKSGTVDDLIERLVSADSE
jgi:methyl-accepting chemotaxis protein